MSGSLVLCKACGQKSFERYSVKEMMFGTVLAYPYGCCLGCGSLQLLELPADMAIHYPPDYYSMEPLKLKAPSAFKGRAQRLALAWLKAASQGPDARILDVGSGSGAFLGRLYQSGFKDLTGIDPHLTQDIQYAPGFKVCCQSLEELRGTYDFISIQHTLEHVLDPLQALRDCRRLLAPGGTLLIRIPVMGKRAWQIYGADWIQIDAPRHLFVPSEAGLGLLAEKAGLSVERTVFDSHAGQFWGSEQHRRGIALWDPDSYAVNRRASVFSWATIMGYRLRSKWLNWRGLGDQACFYLRPKQVESGS